MKYGVINMAKKDDELVLLIDRNELERKAKDNKLNDSDAQNFVDSIMTNYFLDNDNINFLESKDISFFKFSIKEDCFCISGKKFGDCCFNKLSDKIDDKYVPYIKSLMTENDYNDYIKRMDEIFNTEFKKYKNEVNCFFPNCESKPVENKFYHDVETNDFVTSKIYNPFDARYKIGDNFFANVDEKTFTYFGFCEAHYNELKEIKFQNDFEDLDVLKMSLETIVFRLFFQMVQFKSSHYEYLKWYNSVPEEGFKAYMTVHMRKVSGILKGMLNLYKNISDNIANNTMARLKIWTLNLPGQKNFICRDLVSPQVTPEDFKMVNSVNNVLLTPKFIVQSMITNKKETKVFYLYEKFDGPIADFVKQYQLRLIKKSANEFFVSNTSLILADTILFSKKWFNKRDEQDQILYSALNKFRFDQPDIGREYMKMQFFAGFDRGNNFFN
jgi:transposase-like protein